MINSLNREVIVLVDLDWQFWTGSMLVRLIVASLQSPFSPYSVRSPVYNKSTAIPGLSRNPRTRNKLKDISLLLEKGFPKNRVDIVCWHDVINNSITPHKSNGNQPLSVEQLLEIPRKHSEKFAAIIYCQRFGTANIFDKL